MRSPTIQCRLATAAFGLALPLLAAAAAAPKLSVREEGAWRVIEANGIPAHATGAFPNADNPHRIEDQDRVWRLALEPKGPRKAADCGMDVWGVAVNGVPFDPGTAEFWKGDPRSGWRYEALGPGVRLGLDEHRAHVQPGGAYHYHGLPTGLMEGLGGAEAMRLLGWAADGFPVYGSYAYKQASEARSGLRKMRSSWRLKTGQRPGGPGGAFDGTFVEDYEFSAGSGDLDECNGRFGVSPEHPRGTYYYVITEEFPYIPRCWKGEPHPSFKRREPVPRRQPPPRRRRAERPKQLGGGPLF